MIKVSICEKWKWTMAWFRYFRTYHSQKVGVAATKSVNAKVQRMKEDSENEAAQCQGHKCKVYTRFTPKQSQHWKTYCWTYGNAATVKKFKEDFDVYTTV